MNTDRSSQSNIPPEAQEIGPEYQNTLASLDTLSAQRMQTLQRVYQSRLSQQSRALADAKSQFGPDSPEAQAAQALVAATTQTAAQVASTHQQLGTPDPSVAPEGWALHGRVFDAQGNPYSRFTVFLVDGQKAYQAAFGFSYTDESGYFLINFAGPQSTTKRETTPQLFVEIVDTRARPVYLSESAFEPVPGAATYLTIVLSAGDRPIGDPPKEIREITFPKGQGKKSPPGSKRK